MHQILIGSPWGVAPGTKPQSIIGASPQAQAARQISLPILTVRTLPGGWAHSPVAGHPPLVGACSLSPPKGGGVERRLELLLQGNSPKCPRGSFSFWEKSSCSILWLPLYKEGPVLSHSPPLQLGRGLSGSGSHTAQLSTLLSQHPWSPWVYHFVLIPHPATSGNQVSTVLLRPCLAGEGAVNPALSQESCGRPRTGGSGAAATLVPVLVPGTFLS